MYAHGITKMKQEPGNSSIISMFFNAYKKFWKDLINFVMPSATLSAVVTIAHVTTPRFAVTITVETCSEMVNHITN